MIKFLHRPTLRVPVVTTYIRATENKKAFYGWRRKKHAVIINKRD